MSHKKRPKRKMSSIQWSPKKMRRMLFLIALFIIPPFVLWGVSSAIRSEKEYKIGKVGRQTITLPIWQRAYRHVQAGLKEDYGDKARTMFKPEEIKRSAWERLLLLYEAKQQHIKVSDEEVLDNIVKRYQFLQDPDGGISVQRYSRYVRMLGLNEKDFEEYIRENLILKKLFDSVTKDISVSDKEVEEAYRDKEEKLDFLYGKALQKDFLDKVTVSDDEVKAYYEKHKDDFLKPVTAKVKYIELSLADVRKKIAVNKDEIKKYYDTHPQEFTGKAFQDVEDDIYKKLEEKEAKKSFDFLVKQFSRHRIKDLENTAKKYGLKVKETPYYSARQILPQIGWVPQFYSKAFSLDIGDVSELFKAGDKYYMVQVTDKKEAYIPELDEIKEQVSNKVKQEKAKQLAKEKAGSLRQQVVDAIKAIENPGEDSFKDAFKKVFSEAQEAKSVSRQSYVQGMGIAKDFFDEVVKADPVSDLIEVRDGWVVALKLKFTPIDEKKFEEEKETLRKSLLDKKKSQEFVKYEQELFNKIHMTIYKENY